MFAAWCCGTSGWVGNVKTPYCARVDNKMQPIVGSEFTIKVDLVLLAVGFVQPVYEGLLRTLGVELEPARQRARDNEFYARLERLNEYWGNRKLANVNGESCRD